MASQVELERIAGAISKLRPEWSARSIRTWLESKPDLADRAFADLAVAFTVVACDRTTTSPARLAEHGPWWSATRINIAASTPEVGPGRGEPPCAIVGHEHEPALRCRLCRAIAIAGTEPEPPAPARPVPAPDDLKAARQRLRETRAANAFTQAQLHREAAASVALDRDQTHSLPEQDAS